MSFVLFIMTIACYVLSYNLYKRSSRLLLHPIIITSVAIIALLFIFNISSEQYAYGTRVFQTLLMPVTVSLAVPLYRYRFVISKHLTPVLTSIIAGAAVGLVTPLLIVCFMQGNTSLAMSLAPKSTTTPIAMVIADYLGGTPSLTAVFTVITGLIGSFLARPLLVLFGIHDSRVIALAIGVSSHGIGTAYVLNESEQYGAFSAFAMAATGIITVLFSLALM